MSKPTTQLCIKENKLIDVSDLPICPAHYFQRGGECDLKWIIRQMRHVPPAKQREVSDEYERLFVQKGGRKVANFYLHGVAKEFRLARCKR